MNFLWIDVETTGRFADKHDIIQLACIPVIKGKRQTPFNEFCQPLSWNTIEQGAIDVHGITVDRMKTFQRQNVMLDKFVEYVKSFGVKFVIAGFNVGFDKRFLSALFSKHGRESEFFTFFDLQIHDTYARAQTIKTKLGTENLKLATLAKHYKIEIDAHEALSDIGATIDVDYQIGKLLGEDDFYEVDEVADVESTVEFPEPAQLHLHSMYGMVESVPTVDEWAEWCIKTKTPGFSVVDHGSAISIFGVAGIKNKKDKNKNPVYPGLTGIPGVGLYAMLDPSNPDDLYPVSAWAISNEGYFNLMKLASLGYDAVVEIDGISVPRVSVEDLKKYSNGISFGTADVNGAVGQKITEGNASGAEEAFKRYVDTFGDKLYVEFNPISITYTFSAKKGFQRIKKNDLVKDGDLNKAYNLFLAKMVDKYSLNCVPVSGAHFIEQNDKLIQDCIARNSYSSGKSYNESYHAKTAKDLFKELKRHLGDWLTEDKFSNWIMNTHKVMEMAMGIDIKYEYHLPEITIPDHIKAKTDDYDKQVYYLTVELCMKHGRWNDSPEYVERFKKEINVIMKNGKVNFLPYFLLYEEICSYARSQGIMQNIGRGSAGGCLLSYYLKIIHIDPIAADLPFERFLSLARINAGSFPDIDCDFGDREPIIHYLKEKYGIGFAQVGTYLKMKTKNAIKDAMWALYGTNREDPNLKAICELIPDSPQGVDEYDFLYGYTDKEDTYHPGVVEIYDEVATFFKQYPAVEEMVKRLIGVVRGCSRHPSAYVISTVDLSHSRIPTMKMWDKEAGEWMTVTQFEAPMVEACGLVKADILGVTTINIVSECVRLVKESTGIDYMEEDDKGVALIYRLPEDPRVYKDFFDKKTDSSFQFNTNLIKGYIQQFAPTEREHLSAMTALCRPGALDAPFMNDEISINDGVTAAQYYMDVRNGKRKLGYLHPDLAICTSNGIFVYQEEVMKFLVEIAGYTLEESDQIRGAIAKKKHDVMMSTFARIREATAKRGWTKEQADAVCNQIQAFARYSFNRSHSRCYGELGYITMYLKHHHKLEWWTGVLNSVNDSKGAKKEEKLRHFMTLLGTIVRPPSITKPSNRFEIVDDRIVAPLSVLKSIGPASIAELVSKGPFVDLDDYIKRVAHNKVNAGHFSALVQGRAADALMDQSLPYPEARKKLLDDYVAKRKCKKFSDELYNMDPLAIFLMEREINRCFNKNLLDDPAVSMIIETKMPSLEYTGRRNVPFIYNERTHVLGSVKVAERMIAKEHDGEVGMILLFDSSTHKSGISKKSRRKWSHVKSTLTDGFLLMEGVWWDKDKALGWPKNSIVFVKGKLSDGRWGGIPNITISHMERIT